MHTSSGRAVYGLTYGLLHACTAPSAGMHGVESVLHGPTNRDMMQAVRAEQAPSRCSIPRECTHMRSCIDNASKHTWLFIFAHACMHACMHAVRLTDIVAVEDCLETLRHGSLEGERSLAIKNCMQVRRSRRATRWGLAGGWACACVFSGCAGRLHAWGPCAHGCGRWGLCGWGWCGWGWCGWGVSTRSRCLPGHLLAQTARPLVTSPVKAAAAQLPSTPPHPNPTPLHAS
eukprot:67506-Chlamydomonas_euryale.AAC.2